MPGPPRNVEITDWDTNRVELKWMKPMLDGGSPITNYVIECKEKFSSDWVKCHMTDGPETEAKVTDVIKAGKSYEFRVRAVNKAGPGEPSSPSEQVN